VLDGTYLADKRWFPAFSPYSAWALAHLLFFSDEWRTPLHNYLAAVARGQTATEAAAALGDVRKLAKELSSYRGKKVSFERLTYAPSQFQPPLIRRLKQSEAVYVRGRLELGARVTIADAAAPGTSAADAARAQQKGLEARDKWLAGLRTTAAAYPDELADQQLLAEAECRSGYADRCVAAADRALGIAPNDPVATNWKGYGLALYASQGPAADRRARLDDARSTIIRANRLDTESVLPLLAYYRSYTLAGEAAPDVAVDGLAKSLDEVPSTPTTRLLLGGALVQQSDKPDARRILLPVARGAFDPPEKTPAQQLLATIAPPTPADGGAASH
jgi:tetratricopeptide (TPR) repeat protein